MSMLELGDRSRLAARLREKKAGVAHAVITELLAAHPELSRFGERAYVRGVEDAEYHIEFLAAAVEAGSAALFGNYLRWTGRVLEARGVARALVTENIHQIAAAVLVGETGDAAALITEVSDAALARFEEPEGTTETELHAELDASRALFVEAALRGDRKAAFQIALHAFTQGATAVTLYVELFQRGMYEIGQRWEANKLSVAQEHMGTATVQYVVAQLYARLSMPAPTRGKAIITGVEGEHHQLGANLVADALEAVGFDVRFLGSDVPAAAVLRAIEDERPSLVGISITIPFNLPKAIALVRAIQALPQDRAPRILLGGAAFSSAPHLAAELGVLGIGRDVNDAVALACSAPFSARASTCRTG